MLKGSEKRDYENWTLYLLATLNEKSKIKTVLRLYVGTKSLK